MESRKRARRNFARARERTSIYFRIHLFLRNSPRGFGATCHDERDANYKMYSGHFTTCGHRRPETALACKLRRDSSKVGDARKSERGKAEAKAARGSSKWTIKIATEIIGLPLERNARRYLSLIETLTLHTHRELRSALFMQNAIRGSAHSTTRACSRNKKTAKCEKERFTFRVSSGARVARWLG